MDSWIGANLSFYLITFVVLFSAALAAFSNSIVTAAFSLFFTLFGIAGYYVLLGSDFLAVTQVVIYVGGILVLLMFGVLLTNRPLERIQASGPKSYGLALLVGTLLLSGILFRVIFATNWEISRELVEPVSSLRSIGNALLDQYVLPFEVSGITLLFCLIGAAYLVRRRDV